MNRLFTAGFVGAVSMALIVTAKASGPEWNEIVDAGSLPPDAQTTMGDGPLFYINGGLGMTALAGEIDFEDMYLIRIFDPKFFRATTDPEDDELMDASAEFDTQLWLFKPVSEKSQEALGFLGNNDHPFTGSTHALLIPEPTDDSPPLVDAGLYYITITRWVNREMNDPISAGGEIFFQKEAIEISDPDGVGGAEPILGWTGDEGKFDGQYRIALRCATFAEFICPWDIDHSGSVGAGDLLSLLASWGPCKGCPADFDGDGNVGASDLLALLVNWGPCP